MSAHCLRHLSGNIEPIEHLFELFVICLIQRAQNHSHRERLTIKPAAVDKARRQTTHADSGRVGYGSLIRHVTQLFEYFEQCRF